MEITVTEPLGAFLSPMFLATCTFAAGFLASFWIDLVLRTGGSLDSRQIRFVNAYRAFGFIAMVFAIAVGIQSIGLIAFPFISIVGFLLGYLLTLVLPHTMLALTPVASILGVAALTLQVVRIA